MHIGIKIFLLIYFEIFYIFGVCWVFAVACGLCLISVSWGFSIVVVHGLLIVVASLVAESRL